MTEPAVSAAICVRDGERFLAHAIESVLAQTVPCAELLVVDNGSRDRSLEVAQRYAGDGVRAFEEPTPGVANARNVALGEYRGTHLAFLDADDLWKPEKNEIQLAALERSDEETGSPAVAFGHVAQFVEGSPEDLSPPQRGLLTSALVPREAFEAIGPWPAGVGNTAEGLDWLLRVRRAGLPELMVDDVVLLRRIHGANVGFRERSERTEMARVVKRELDRRRAEGG